MKNILILILVLACSVAYADSQCPQLYPLGHILTVQNTTELCNQEYVALYDISRKANILSAEKFDASISHAPRLNEFHSDARLKSSDRATNDDYLKSGYDKGHMAPAADMTTPSIVNESFLLSNMTPQEPTLNRLKWKMLEENVRSTATGITYVLTGAVYSNSPKTIGVDNIPVPSKYYKCVWYSSIKTACYKADNVPHADVTDATLEEAEAALNIKE